MAAGTELRGPDGKQVSLRRIQSQLPAYQRGSRTWSESRANGHNQDDQKPWEISELHSTVEQTSQMAPSAPLHTAWGTLKTQS